MKHALSKKIANLTKIIYNLNVRNENYEEEVQECRKRNKKEIENIITRHNSETLSFRKEFEVKDEMIEALNVKHDLLRAQIIQEKSIQESERIKYEEAVQKVKDECLKEFHKEIKKIENDNRISVHSLTQSCHLLKKQLGESLKKNEDTNQNYKVEISSLKDAHKKCMTEISEEKEIELRRARLDHERIIDELECSMRDARNEFKDKMEKIRKDMQLDCDSMIKQAVASSSNENEDLKVENSKAHSEITSLRGKLKSTSETIKSKDRENTELQSSLKEMAKNLDKRSKEAVYERIRVENALKTKCEELVLERSLVSKLKDEVLGLHSKCLNYSKLSISMTEMKESLVKKLHHVEDEKTKMSISLSNTNKSIEESRYTQKLSYKKMSTIVQNLKLEQRKLKEGTYAYQSEVISMIHCIHNAFYRNKSRHFKQLHDIKTEMSHEIQNSQSLNKQISSLQEELNELRNKEKKRESQLKQENDQYKTIIKKLEEEIVRLNLMIENGNKKLLENKDNGRKLVDIMHELKQSNSKLKSEVSELNRQQKICCLERTSLQNKLYDIIKVCDGNKDKNRLELQLLQDEIQSSQESLQILQNRLEEKENILKSRECSHSESIDNLNKKHQRSMKFIEDQMDEKVESIEKLKQEHQNRIKEITDCTTYEINQKDLYHRQKIKDIEKDYGKKIKSLKEENAQMQKRNIHIQSTVEMMGKKCNLIENDVEIKKNELSKQILKMRLLEEKYSSDINEKSQCIHILLKDKEDAMEKVRIKAKVELQTLHEQLRHYKEQASTLENQIQTITNDRTMWIENKNKLQSELSQEREATKQLQVDLKILREQSACQIKTIVALNSQINKVEEDLRKSIFMNKKITTRSKETMKKNLSLDAKLRMTCNDLDTYFYCLSKREVNRLEYVSRIQNLEHELVQCVAGEERAKGEMDYYKNELKNREENYNSIFGGGRTKQQVGLVSVINQTNSTIPHTSHNSNENSKKINLRSRQKSLTKKQVGNKVLRHK